MSLFRRGYGTLGLVIFVIALSMMAAAETTYSERGNFIRFQVCSALPSGDHELLMRRLNSTGDFWVSQGAIAGFQLVPGQDCTLIQALNGRKINVKGSPDDILTALEN